MGQEKMDAKGPSLPDAIGCTEEWVPKLYESGLWGVRQSPSTPSVCLEHEDGNHELLPLGFAICSIVEQGETGEAHAHLIAAAPRLLELAKRACFLQEQSKSPDEMFAVLRIGLSDLLPCQTLNKDLLMKALAEAGKE